MDILGITETWHRSNEDLAVKELAINDLTNVFKPRPSGKPGGGVGIVFKKHFVSHVVPLPEYNSFEQLCVSLSHPDLSTISVTVIYRPPSLPIHQFLDDIEDFFERTCDIRNHVIIGDFNIHYDVPDVRTTKLFMNVIESHGFCQHVNEQTHVGGHTLDLVLSRGDENIVDTISCHDFGISDHSLILLKLSLRKPTITHGSVRVRCWRKFDFDSFRDDLLASKLFDTSFISTVSSPSLLATVYNNIMSSLVNLHAPFVSKKSLPRPSVPWFNRELTLAIRNRRKLERTWRQSRTDADRDRFVHQRNNVQRIVRRAKTANYEDFFSKHLSDPKSLWTAIRESLCCNPTTVYPMLDVHRDVSSVFADFFRSKISTINDNMSPSCMTCDDRSSSERSTMSCFSEVTADEAIVIMCSMKSKTCALDPAPTWLVKLLLRELSSVFSLFANLSLKSGNFPASEKRAIITPILKKSSMCKNKLSNYRPVSCLSFLSKFVERVVSKQINAFLMKHDLFCPYQSAYRSGYSTESVLLHFYNELALAKARNLSTCIVFLDLSAAFDTVDHSFLIDRLSKRYGFSDVVLNWFTSYLSERSQRIVVNYSMSDWHPVCQGIPQGSVLGPLLYSLYASPASDIIESYNLSFHTYADDIAIFISFDSNNCSNALLTLQNCTLHLCDWFNSNRLHLNPDKSCALFCASRSCPVLDKVWIGDVVIPTSSTANYLGVTLDESLSLRSHISRVCRSSFAFVRSLWRVRPFINEHTASLIIHAYIASRVDYCNGILATCPLYHLRPLKRVQNACVRVLKCLSRTVPTSPFLRELHWLPIPQRIEFKICCLVHKCIYGFSPTYLRSLLRVADSTFTNTNLRSHQGPLLYQPLGVRRLDKGAFSVCGPRFWNSLPLVCRCEPSFARFKKILKAELCKRQ